MIQESKNLGLTNYNISGSINKSNLEFNSPKWKYGLNHKPSDAWKLLLKKQTNPKRDTYYYILLNHYLGPSIAFTDLIFKGIISTLPSSI